MYTTSEIHHNVVVHADLYYDGEFTLLRKKEEDQAFWLFCFQRVDEVDSGVEELMAKGDTPEEAMRVGLAYDLSYIEIEAKIWNDVYNINHLFYASIIETELGLPLGTINELCCKKDGIQEMVLNGHLLKEEGVWMVSEVMKGFLKSEYSDTFSPLAYCE
ncbi:hypothetical protein AB685_21515 [Bacillus sp. LL01]|uniref:hypothetical protein n=1 Tax=Bacillus sp. LL01 TaxID=1665556 RepID=UPI00064D40CE|nr:hypothetical protein [Bacillus sp. LL01]KMJ56508.1 hypothetical protein AB685_21515 [Bacillus sp. LL01]